MSQQQIDIKDLIPGCYIFSDERPDQPLIYQGNSMFFGNARVVPIGNPDKLHLVSYESLTGIPITPEWLLRLGFVDYDNRFELEGGYEDSDESYTACSINWAQTSDYFVFTDASERAFDIAIHSVHHLQAVFWNLERHWLTISEKEVQS